MNLFIFCGKVYEEINLSSTNSGIKFCNIPLEISERRKKKDEFVEEQTLIPKITVWGNRAIKISECSVGTKLLIQGRVTSREWQGKYYNDFVASDVQILSSGEDNDSRYDDGDIPF